MTTQVWNAEGVWPIELVEISGEDAGVFLQRITSNDVSSLVPGFFQYQTILDTSGKIIVAFTLFCFEDAYLALLPRACKEDFFSQLEFYHFGESVTYTHVPFQDAFIIEDPELDHTMALYGLHSFQNALSHGFRFDTDAGKGYALQLFDGLMPRALLVGNFSKNHPIRQSGVATLTSFEKNRLLAGMPRWSEDFDKTTYLLETDVQLQRVSFDKGCYPGQEVVARTYFRGEPAKKQFRFVLESSVTTLESVSLSVKGVPCGWLTSMHVSDESEKTIALGYLKKNGYRHSGDIECLVLGEPVSVSVENLSQTVFPLFLDLYGSHLKKGLDLYHAGDYPKAKTELLKALTYVPFGEDALEAVSLCFEKLSDIDKAIACNKTWGRVNQQAVMARVNLSRLHMLLGDKDKAEEYQARATALSWKQSGEQTGEKTGDTPEDREEKLKDRQRKLGIFKEVLEMDEHDEIANFGIGKIYLEMGLLPLALKHLQKVALQNVSYSAVYPLIAETCLKQGNKAEAREWLLKGIPHVQKKGDLMPLRQMEQMLKEC